MIEMGSFIVNESKLCISFSPNDAVDVVKEQVDVVLSKNGGQGCVRELIDLFILNKPLNK